MERLKTSLHFLYKIYMEQDIGGYNNSMAVYRQESYKKPVTVDDIIRIIEANIADTKDFIDKSKESVYKMASHYEYVRDHSVEIANIKAEVRNKEIELNVLNHCLRIAKGETNY